MNYSLDVIVEMCNMFSCWALAHGCYMVQVKARANLISPDLESSVSRMYMTSCSAATVEGKIGTGEPKMSVFP